MRRTARRLVVLAALALATMTATHPADVARLAGGVVGGGGGFSVTPTYVSVQAGGVIGGGGGFGQQPSW